MSDNTRYWFPAKRYGWGWGLPTMWQGWVALLAFVVALAVSAFVLLPQNPKEFVVVTIIAVAVLTGVSYMKGEPPSWRWGGGK
jgi:lipoprotein signal peptidase